jgi:hypothetical protein
MVTSSTLVNGRYETRSHVVIRSFLRVAQPVTRFSMMANTA